MKVSFTHKSIHMKIQPIFIWKVLHLDSFWNRGRRQLGNGIVYLLAGKINTRTLYDTFCLFNNDQDAVKFFEYSKLSNIKFPVTINGERGQSNTALLSCTHRWTVKFMVMQIKLLVASQTAVTLHFSLLLQFFPNVPTGSSHHLLQLCTIILHTGSSLHLAWWTGFLKSTILGSVSTTTSRNSPVFWKKKTCSRRINLMAITLSYKKEKWKKPNRN